MKKRVVFLMAATVLSIAAAIAQPRAIGANLGSGLGFSYRHNLGEANMLDVNVDVPLFYGGALAWGIGGSVTYDWIDPFNAHFPWEHKGEWYWEMGVGAGAGIYGFNSPVAYTGVAGHVGVEYNFWFPLELSVDWRPNIGIWAGGGNVGFNAWGLGIGSLGVRYRF